MVPFLLAAGALAPSTALAFDIDLWRPGPSSASPADALTAPSAWTLGAGQTSVRWANLWVPGTLYSVVVPASCDREDVLAGSVKPGTLCASDLARLVGGDGTTSVPDDAYSERPLLGPITTTAVVVERGLGTSAAVGVRIRGLWSSSIHPAYGDVTGIGPLVRDVGEARVTDASLWGHWSLSLSDRLCMGIAPELRLDSDTFGSDFPGVPHIGSISGTGTGVASAFSFGWQPAAGTAPGPLRLTLAVTPGLALAPTGRVPEVAPFSTDAWVAASWALSPAWTAVGESSLHWFGHATDVPSFNTLTRIQRAGVRWTPHSSWSVLVTGAYSGSRTPGAPEFSPGLEVQWRQRPAGERPTPRPAVPGEILVSPVDAKGRSIPMPVPEGVAGARPAVPGPGWIVPFVPGAKLTAGGGDWVTRTQPVTPEGPGPWTWQPVLVPRQGEATARVVVVDAADTPMAVDSLTLGDAELGPLPAGSILELEGLAEGPLDLTASGGLIEDILVPSVADLDPDPDPLVVALPIGATRVQVDAAAGATLRARSAIEDRSVPLGPSGDADFSLTPGRWVLRAEAPGQGAQERTLEVDDGRDTIELVDFELKDAAEDGADLVVSVFDADGRPVPDAEVRVGEDAIGRTATGGRLRVEGLSPGLTALSVAADDFRAKAPARLMLATRAETEVEVPLSHEAGVVRLQVRADTGAPLRDVMVRFLGGELVDSMPVGPDGILETTLAAGTWEAVVSAPGHYQHVVDVVVRPERERRLDLDVILRAPAAELGRLSIRVEDDASRPVEGALITLGGEVLGRTSTGGRLGVEGLSPGALPLEVVAPLHDPWSGKVEVVTEPAPEAETISLRLSPGILQIEAADNIGPLNAWARVLGPIHTPGFLLGSDGVRRIAVPPGDWEVVLSEPAHGLMVADVALAPDASAVVRWEAEDAAAPSAIQSLARVPLTVSVVDASVDAPINAQVRMLGPEVLPLMHAAPGEPAVIRVRPGFWEIVASSPEHGIGGADLSVQTSPPPPVVIPLGERRAQVTADAVEISETIEFALDSARLAPASTDLLREIARTLQLHPELTVIMIEGHTDDSGDPIHNELLSRARAKAVREWLVSSGVSASRLETLGFGARSPLTDNESAAGRARNRRVEFRIVSRRAEVPDTP